MLAHWVALTIAVLFQAVAARPAIFSPSSVSITSGIIPTVSPGLSPCPARDNAWVFPSASDRVYVVECGTDNYGGDIQGQSPQHVEDFDHCLKVCDALPHCIAISFDSEIGETGAYFCYPKDKASTKVSNPKLIGASFLSRRAPSASSGVSALGVETILSSSTLASSTSKVLPTLSSSSVSSSLDHSEKSTHSDSSTAPGASSGTLSSSTSSTVAMPSIPSSITLESSMESMALTLTVVTNTVPDAATPYTLKTSGTVLSMSSMPPPITLNLSTRSKTSHLSTGIVITSTVSDATMSSTLKLLSPTLSTLSSSSSGIPVSSTRSKASNTENSRSTMMKSSSSYSSYMTTLPLENLTAFTSGNSAVPTPVSSHASNLTSLKPSRTVSATTRGPTDFAVTLPPNMTASVTAPRINLTVTSAASSRPESTVVTLTRSTHLVTVTLPAKTISLSAASMLSSVTMNTTGAVDLTSSVILSRHRVTTTLTLPQASSTSTVPLNSSISVTSVKPPQPEFTTVTDTYRMNRPGHHFTETHTHTYPVIHWNESTKTSITPTPTGISSTGPHNGTTSSTSTALASSMVKATAPTFTHNSLNLTTSTKGSITTSLEVISSQPEYTTVTDTYRVNRPGYHFTETHTHTYSVVHWNTSTKTSITTSSNGSGSVASATGIVAPSDSVHWMNSTTGSVTSLRSSKVPDAKATIVPTIPLDRVNRTTSTTGSAAIISSGTNFITGASSRTTNNTVTPLVTHVFTLSSDYITTTTSYTGFYGTSNEASGTGNPVPTTNVITSASATGPLPTVDGFGVPLTSTTKPAPTRSYAWNRPSHAISKTSVHQNSTTLSSPTETSHPVATSSHTKGHSHSIGDLTVVLSFTESGRNFTSTHRKTLTGTPTNMKPYRPSPTGAEETSIPSGNGIKLNSTVMSSSISKPTVLKTVTRIDPNAKSVYRSTTTSSGAEPTLATETQPTFSSLPASVGGPTQGPTMSSNTNSTSRHVEYSKTTHSIVVTSLWSTKSADNRQSTFTPSRVTVTKSSRPGSITDTSLSNSKTTSSSRPVTASTVPQPFVTHACGVPANNLPLEELLRNTFHMMEAAGEKFYKVNNGGPCSGNKHPNWQSISSVLPKDVLSLFRSGKANFFQVEGDSVYYVKIRDGESETITPVLVDGNYYLDEPEDPACKACFGKNVKNLSTCKRRCKPVIKQLSSVKEIEINEHWTYNAKIGKITVDGVEVLTTMGVLSSTEPAVPSHVTMTKSPTVGIPLRTDSAVPPHESHVAVLKSTAVVSQAEPATTTVSVKASMVTLSTEKIVPVTETISGKDGPIITIVPSKTTLWVTISYQPKVTTLTFSSPVVTAHEKPGNISASVSVPIAFGKSSKIHSVSSIPAPSVTFVTSSRTVTYSGADSSASTNSWSSISSSSSSVKSSSSWLGSGTESTFAASYTGSDSSTIFPSASTTVSTIATSYTGSGSSTVSPSASPTKSTDESTFIPGIGWRKVSPTAAASDVQPVPHSAASGTKISGTFAMGIVVVVGFFLSF